MVTGRQYRGIVAVVTVVQAGSVEELVVGAGVTAGAALGMATVEETAVKRRLFGTSVSIARFKTRNIHDELA